VAKLTKKFESGTVVTVSDDLSLSIEGSSKEKIIEAFSKPQFITVPGEKGESHLEIIPLHYKSYGDLSEFVILTSVLSIPSWLYDLGVVDRFA